MKKRILVISSEFPPGPGGIGQHAYYLASFLSETFNISVLANGDYATAKDIIDFDKNQKFLVTRFKKLGPLRSIRRIVECMRIFLNLRPDCVIFTGLFTIWLMPLISLINRSTKLIVVIHGHEPIFGSRLMNLITNQSLGFAHKIVPVSRFAASNIRKDWQHDSRISVIPNGIDPMDLGMWGKVKLTASEQLYDNLETTEYPILLTVGHTSRRKGQHNVIASLPSIMKSYPHVKYYCVGRDINNDKLIELAEKLGVSEKVVFIPPCRNRAELLQWYTKADIFMLLSENQPNGDVEGFGIVALEANYFGLPVIGARGCGVEDAVSEGVSGLLVEADQPESVSRAINNILIDYNGYRQRAEKFALKFDWAVIKNRFSEIIN